MIKKSDNRGSTIIMVVLVLVGVGIMAAIALWVSLRNVQMKTTDAEIKESFYSAEGVLEQVKAGVQEKAELAYKEALTKDLENFSKYRNTKVATTSTYTDYTSIDGTDDKLKIKHSRDDEFRNNFKNSFKAKVGTGTADHYSIGKINNLVNKSLIDSPSYPYALVTAMKAGYNGDSGLIKDNGDKLVLQGIRVRYVSDEEQVSEILTDIAINIPKPDAVVSTPIPDVFEYAIIGDSGVEVSTGILKVTGNVYAGNKASADKTAFLVSPNVDVELNDKTLIANGKIIVGDNASLKTGARERLWTENILLNGGSTELAGISYVSDDLTLTGNGSKATISGIYRGYGNAKDTADYSSAIIVNGKNSEIDMSAAKEVVLSGYSYIGTENKKLRMAKPADGLADPDKNTDIKMGESIAIKGNQIAYLMPGEWIGTDSKAESRFNRNPLSYDEYNKLLTEKDAGGKKYTLVNTKVKAKKTGKSLEDYGVNSGNVDSKHSKIFVQPITGISSEGLVYFYINFSQNEAARYFNDYYNADKNGVKELNKHTKFYTDLVKNALDANVKTAGNYSIVDGEELKIKSGKAGSDSKSDEYLKEFKSLRTNLSTEVVAGQIENEIFSNIMNISELNNYLIGHTSREVSVKGIKAVLVKGDYIFDNSKGDVRLIVATGNVEVKQRFTGSIVAAGKITVKTAGEISTDSSGILKQLLREPLTSGGKDYFYKIFKNGDALASAGSSDNVNLLFEDGSVDVSKLISYSNWKKK